MVEVKYKAHREHDSKRENEYMLSCKGHAGYDEKGKDIVCASVSMLAFTLLSMLQKHPEYYGHEGLKFSLTEGNASVICRPKPYPMPEDMVDEIFETIASGYELLSANYPDHVKFIRI